MPLRIAARLKKASAETVETDVREGTDDSYTGEAGKAPASVFAQKPGRALTYMGQRLKTAGNPESPEEGRLGFSSRETGPTDILPLGTIVDPSMPTWSVVEVMSKLPKSREEKATYLARAGFMPQAISAILAQVDGYTEASED